MREFQSIPESGIFQSVQRIIIEQISRYCDQTGARLYGGIHIFPQQEPIILKSKLPLLKILKTALLIEPPYNPSDVHILDKRHKRLGSRLRNELDKFWEFGERYIHPSEDEDDMYRHDLVRNTIFRDFGKRPVPGSEEVWRNHILQLIVQDMQEFAEAQN